MEDRGGDEGVVEVSDLGAQGMGLRDGESLRCAERTIRPTVGTKVPEADFPRCVSPRSQVFDVPTCHAFDRQGGVLHEKARWLVAEIEFRPFAIVFDERRGYDVDSHLSA